MNFVNFRDAVWKQFLAMQDEQILFRTNVNKYKMSEVYLENFPEGSNNFFRTTTQHDCSTCKHFIRSVGNVVAIKDNKLVSIWDVKVDDPAYQKVADALSAFVKAAPVFGKFLSWENKIGNQENFENVPGKDSIKWEHFYAYIDHSRFMAASYEIGEKVGAFNSGRDVFNRALNEIKIEAIDSVLDLINEDLLYRGLEHKALVLAFKKELELFNQVPEEEKTLYVWRRTGDLHDSVLRFRNSVIGTLVVDMGDETITPDAAVASFESKVAPTNYKRSKSLVTKDMLVAAQKEIAELGLESTLSRRYAKLDDLEVKDVLFVDRDVEKKLNTNVFDDLIESAIDKKTTAPKNLDKIANVTIDEFMRDILPNTKSLEILVENRLIPNFMSLIAPTVKENSDRLFKWDNGFSWAYNGDIADSDIKRRVKEAGGNVDADLRISLGWFNTDDLDLHIFEYTKSGEDHIYYSNHRRNGVFRDTSLSGGLLDVDMNVNAESTTPVENVYYKNLSDMKEGKYAAVVHNYTHRNNTDVGFEVEMELQGKITKFEYKDMVKNKNQVTVIVFTYSKENGIQIVEEESLRSQPVSKTEWGLQTQVFSKVNMVMLSPNYWGENHIGNKHYMFLIDKCKNPGDSRGFFNEFLRSDLDKHRKAFEVVGGKIRAEYSDEQVSGLGFSSTIRNSIVIKSIGETATMLRRVNF